MMDCETGHRAPGTVLIQTPAGEKLVCAECAKGFKSATKTRRYTAMSTETTEAVERARVAIEEMHQRGPNAAGRAHETRRILLELYEEAYRRGQRSMLEREKQR